MEKTAELIVQRLRILSSNTVLSEGAKNIADEAAELIVTQDKVIQSMREAHKELYRQITRNTDG